MQSWAVVADPPAVSAGHPMGVPGARDSISLKVPPYLGAGVAGAFTAVVVTAVVVVWGGVVVVCAGVVAGVLVVEQPASARIIASTRTGKRNFSDFIFASSLNIHKQMLI